MLAGPELNFHAIGNFEFERLSSCEFVYFTFGANCEFVHFTFGANNDMYQDLKIGPFSWNKSHPMLLCLLARTETTENGINQKPMFVKHQKPFRES